MTPDEERLQRYLEWRRASDRDRSARRWRAIGYVAAPALCVIAVGLAAWLGRPSSDRSATVNAVAPPIPRESAPSSSGPVSDAQESAISSPAPAPDTRVQAPEPPAVELSEPSARPRPRTAPRVTSRPRVRSDPPSHRAPDAPLAAPVAPPDEGAGDSDVAAAVPPAPAPAPVSPPLEMPREVAPPERREPVAEAQREAPSEAPRPEYAVQNPVQNPPPATTAPAGGAVAVAPPTVRERVAGWARGEVQEFRDGVKREIAGFRSGYEKARDFFRRRDARPPTR